MAKDVHKAFIASGVSVITTNSYALVPFHLGEEQFKKQSGALATIAGKTARTAVNETKKIAVKYQKTWLHIDLSAEIDSIFKVKDWLIEWNIKILNVAGKSASKAPTIYDRVKDIIINILR